jgi:hypothetical protein
LFHQGDFSSLSSSIEACKEHTSRNGFWAVRFPSACASRLFHKNECHDAQAWILQKLEAAVGADKKYDDNADLLCSISVVDSEYFSGPALCVFWEEVALDGTDVPAGYGPCEQHPLVFGSMDGHGYWRAVFREVWQTLWLPNTLETCKAYGIYGPCDQDGLPIYSIEGVVKSIYVKYLENIFRGDTKFRDALLQTYPHRLVYLSGGKLFHAVIWENFRNAMVLRNAPIGTDKSVTTVPLHHTFISEHVYKHETTDFRGVYIAGDTIRFSGITPTEITEMKRKHPYWSEIIRKELKYPSVMMPLCDLCYNGDIKQQEVRPVHSLSRKTLVEQMVLHAKTHFSGREEALGNLYLLQNLRLFQHMLECCVPPEDATLKMEVEFQSFLDESKWKMAQLDPQCVFRELCVTDHRNWLLDNPLSTSNPVP